MSAPLVINLRDGSVWERRAMTAAGVALYALAGSCNCPEYLMASESELAAQGIAGTADVLPVPAGPVDADRAKAPWGRGEDGRPLLPMGAHWTDVPELVDRTVAGIQSRVDEAQSGHWHLALASEGRPAGTVRTNVEGYQRTVGRVTNMGPADLELVLHAHDDLSWCLEMIAKFRAQVEALLVERHSTNESLDDALAELRLLNTQRGDVEQLIERERGYGEECVDIDALESALGLGSDDEAAPKCRCDEPTTDPYECEAEDCTYEFSELNPFGGGSGPVEGHDAKVSRTCGCGWQTSVWHVADGSAEEELHGHVVRAHGGVYPAGVAR